MENIYSTCKILANPEKLVEMRRQHQCFPLQIHLMPENRCNQGCLFCAYRLKGNKNTEDFDSRSSIPADIMINLLDDFKRMGGKAIEITGGGEPLLYCYFDIMAEEVLTHGFDYALVTNGSLLTEETAKAIAPKMTWTRISIDAGTAETYKSIRRCAAGDFDKALEAIRYLRRYAKNPEFRLGVGFVISNENYWEIKKLCELAKDAGADNVRISAVFHPDKLDYFKKETIADGKRLAKEAEGLNDDSFHIYNLFDERIDNIVKGKQDYRFCGTKELLCVVGGDSRIYYCCSLAFCNKGLIGDLREKGFLEIWQSPAKLRQFYEFDASKTCAFMCLYENRNKQINELLKTPLHANFI